MRINLLFFIGFWLILYGFSSSALYFIFTSIILALTYIISYKLKLLPKLSVNARFFTYAFWLLKEIAKSAWYVTKIIWSPKIKISPQIIYINCKQLNNLGKVIYANSITLTPGTYTIELDNQQLIVHALTEECAISLQNDESMIKKVGKIVT